ncbi:FeoB-associated Cys-rich membrane protein [Pedobacter yonginense]|uniref:FeoB-associated Cys-rich membrane protein n=1 Tax=Pedobacter yonginense TaxID=651869 RepID=UPI00140265BA|nr:FeoB-associated Cys-rich membrane protein [Pedobacter yonginense]
MMNVNYLIVAAVLAIVLALIIFIIRRNKKDEKKFEQDVIDTELGPEKDDKENA